MELSDLQIPLLAASTLLVMLMVAPVFVQSSQPPLVREAQCANGLVVAGDPRIHIGSGE